MTDPIHNLTEIFETHTPGSLGFCRAVESHCSFDISHDEIAAIGGRARTAEEFEEIWHTQTWWQDR